MKERMHAAKENFRDAEGLHALQTKVKNVESWMSWMHTPKKLGAMECSSCRVCVGRARVATFSETLGKMA